MIGTIESLFTGIISLTFVLVGITVHILFSKKESQVQIEQKTKDEKTNVISIVPIILADEVTEVTKLSDEADITTEESGAPASLEEGTSFESAKDSTEEVLGFTKVEG